MPDLVIIDISLQGTSGIELAKNILLVYPKMFLLMISMYDESIYLERCLRAGAKGYIMKQEATEHIIAAIRKVLKGENYVSDKMKDNMMHQFINGGKPVEGSMTVKLSDRELEVLQLTGQGYSTHHIAAMLFISVKTVESHYANIKNKLDLQNSHELIQYAVKMKLAEST
ncbi:MAG: Response regulator receiver protein [uncultured bacterium]|nr:MAG: Response regulator receiver protein [uncultured bacterium]